MSSSSSSLDSQLSTLASQPFVIVIPHIFASSLHVAGTSFDELKEVFPKDVRGAGLGLGLGSSDTSIN